MKKLDVYLLAWTAIFAASICRLVIPYLKKKEGDPQLAFDYKFLRLMILSLFLAFVASFFVIQTWTPPTEIISYVLVFGNAFIYGWGQSDIIFEFINWRS